MFRNSTPMDSEDKAIFLSIAVVAICIMLLLGSIVFFITRTDQHKLPGRIERQKTLQTEVKACTSLSSDSAVTLCLNQIVEP